MKTLLIAGLAGIFAVAPSPAIAAIDSDAEGPSMPIVDISFASSTALASPAAGTKSMPRMGKMQKMRHMGGGHKMKQMGNMRHMKRMGNMHQMKRMGNMRQMKRMGNMRHVAGSNCRGHLFSPASLSEILVIMDSVNLQPAMAGRAIMTMRS